MPPESSEEAAVPQEAPTPEGREPTMPPEPPEEAPASLDTSISEETELTTPHEQREEVPAPPEATIDTSISEETELTTPHEQREEVPAPPEATITEKRVTDMPMVSTRKEQFLIARTGGPLPLGVQPVDLGALEQALKEGHIPGSAYKKTLTRRDTVGALAAGLVGPEAVIVAELDQGPAAQLQQHPGLIVERDHRLRYTQPAPPLSGPLVRDPGVVIPNGTGFTATLIVMGEGGTPIEGAEVYLYGSLWPVQGVTDAGGRVQLTLFGEASNSVRALYVKPKSDYWSLWITRPALDLQQDNTISLTPLNQTFPDFPDQQVVGWGLKAMKVDRLPPQYQGKGVKVAVIDSGAATSHKLLLQVKGGWDTITDNNETWRQDMIFYGSHCSGVIAGHADNMLGIRGIAPEAEVYAYKIFPEGRFSNLIEALDLCIEQKVDVVNLSLGSDQPSELGGTEDSRKRSDWESLASWPRGIPGGRSSPQPLLPTFWQSRRLASKVNFPPESYHSTRVLEDGAVLSRDGYFAPSSAASVRKSVSAAQELLSSLLCLPNNYAAWDEHVDGCPACDRPCHPNSGASSRLQGALQSPECPAGRQGSFRSSNRVPSR